MARRVSVGHRRLHSRAGFALVVVIWGVGLIALFIQSFVSAARLRTQATINIAGSAQAEALAEAAVNIAILDRVFGTTADPSRNSRLSPDGAPLFCAMPQNAVAAILIEDERGKIDLNAASVDTLQEFLEQFSVDPKTTRSIAEAIVSFRTAAVDKSSADGASAGGGSIAVPEKRAAFTSALELDQVRGVTPDIFRRLAPFATVYSGVPNIDQVVAPPALFAAFSRAGAESVSELIDRPYPNDLVRPDASVLGVSASTPGVFLIHAEILTAGGSRFTREAIVDFRDQTDSDRFSIKEWRRGQPRYAGRLGEAIRAGRQIFPAC